MALNWDAFLNNESLDVPNDQWSDLSAPSTGLSTSDMPKSISSQTSGSTPEDTSAFDSLLSGASADPYFNDSLFISNDYFLSDLEVLQPFGNIVGGESTTESSPEPTTVAADLSSYHIPTSMSTASNIPLPMAPSQQRPSVNRANTFPNPTYESMFPNNIDAGFVEDITFPDGVKEASISSRPSMERNKTAINMTTTKRNKNQPDALSACWTSPLCPNHEQDGPPPNPSTCSGGCAPFLFAEDNLPTPTIKNPLVEPQEITAEDGVVEIQPRPKKRSESETSATEPSGRRFSTMDSAAVLAEARQRMKSETSEDSPLHGSPPAAADDKPKNRRRLPHNQVERKYRESLNTQLDSLRRVVPSLQQNPRACDGADIEDLPAPSKPSKAVILASATAHIKQQEKDKKSLQEENALLRARIKALQALVKCDDCSLMQYVMDMKIHQAK